MDREQRIIELIERTKSRISDLERRLTQVMMPSRWHFTVGMLETNKHLLALLESMV